MNIHEYQAKELLGEYGLPIHRFKVVSSKEEIPKVIEELGVDKAVVKVQVHAGGRGKAGGVKVATSKEKIIEHANNLLGMKIVNNQTGKAGVVAHKIMIADLADIAKEFYFGIIIDRKMACPLIMASKEGGMEIEEVAEKDPAKILKVALTYDGKITSEQTEEITNFLGWSGKTKEQGKDIIVKMVEAFSKMDGSILEINPLIEDEDGNLYLLDAKINIDESALYRQKNIAAMYDPTQESKAEARAHELDLAYVAMDGNIGCMVNGAGLAMATMDIIKDKGGDPANFLDVGGSATKEKVIESFKMILSDEKVEGILVNIFGGIMRCDVIAEGIVAAVKEINLHVPLVVRLEGTNVEKGKKIIQESNLKVVAAQDLGDAAEKIVAEVKKGG